MRKLIKSSIILIGLINLSFATTLVWDKKPLDVTLPVGKQIYMSFPDTVQIGVPISLKGSQDIKPKLDVQNSNDTLYLTALEPFPATQLKLRTAHNKIILINFSAQSKASTEAINVIFPKPTKKKDFSIKAPSVSMKQLVQYAIQNYYAPERLKPENPNISKSMGFSVEKYNLFEDGSVTAIPLDSFSSNDLTVTAIYLKNNLNTETSLIDNDTKNPIDICGNWVGSAFFPISQLGKAGSEQDSTLLFLLSKNDFISTYKGTCDLGVDDE